MVHSHGAIDISPNSSSTNRCFEEYLPNWLIYGLNLGKYSSTMLVDGFHHLEKYDFVNGVGMTSHI
jgi:hypothetical protein